MKALKLKLFQETACYKKPYAFKVSETYPLPPYSTLKGMFHSILNATEFIPMKISIQGDYETLINDYQTHYFFKKDNTKEFPLTTHGLGIDYDMQDITTMPIYMHLLFNVNLIVHVQAEENILSELNDKINNGNTTFLSLGRWEDLVRIDSCELVELSECKEEPILKYNAFVPIKHLDLENYFPYNLNWKYEIINGVRVWEKIKVGYIQKNVAIENIDELYVDEDDELVFFP